MAEKIIISGEVQDWLAKIAEYENAAKKWESRVEKILKKYRDEERELRRGNAGSRFNILWSNIQILIPATFYRLPKPDVSRKHRDNDPVGRVASLILERALSYEIGAEPDFRDSLTQVIRDRFLGGRGQAWVRYEPRFIPGEPVEGLELTEDAEENEPTQEILDWEHSPVDYVHWRDFGHSVARTWEEVTAVWRKVYLGRDALIERFGEELGRKIPLDTTPEELKKAGSNLGNVKNSQALVYEIWDKSNREAIWLSKSMGEILDKRADPLGLDGFWPCPKPLFATLTSDSLIPVPDFALYQDQARQLDVMSDRIDGLVNALKVTGVYDASQTELGRLFKEADNTALIPVKNWAAFAEKSGLKGAIDLVDLTPIASALRECYAAMEQIKAQVYEITGISDILRGATDPSETLGAQQIKTSSGSLRMKANQMEVARFASDLIRIKAQIICSQYAPETIIKMSAADQLQGVDQQLIIPALQLLKDNVTRGFRIDVEADSMVQIDEVGEKAARVEFLQATGGFIKEAMSAVQSSPQIAPLALEMLKFGVTGFKVGNSLEGVFDETADQIKQFIEQQQNNPQPNPELLKQQAAAQQQQAELQYKAQADAMKMQHEMQLEEFRAQKEMQVEQFRQQVQAAQVQHQNTVEAQRDALQHQNEMQLEQMRIALDSRIGELHEQIALLIAKIGAASRIEVAEIAASSDLQSQQIAAANQAEVWQE